MQTFSIPYYIDHVTLNVPDENLKAAIYPKAESYQAAFPEAELVREALELSKIHKNIVIKIPITKEGLKAVSRLHENGIRTNVTLIFSPAQALLAARAGASYVSPFVGRLNDISSNGNRLIESIAAIFDMHGIETEIIAASIRSPEDVVDAALAGAHIATIPYKVICQMICHPLTDAGIKRFLKDWENVPPRELKYADGN